MKYLFIAPNMTGPTFETLQETTFRMFKKIEDLLRKFNQAECTIKISVTKEARNQVYKINVEVLDFRRENPIVVIKDSDLRKAVGKASNKLKEQIVSRRKMMLK